MEELSFQVTGAKMLQSSCRLQYVAHAMALLEERLKIVCLGCIDAKPSEQKVFGHSWHLLSVLINPWHLTQGDVLSMII